MLRDTYWESKEMKYNWDVQHSPGCAMGPHRRLTSVTVRNGAILIYANDTISNTNLTAIQTLNVFLKRHTI